MEALAGVQSQHKRPAFEVRCHSSGRKSLSGRRWSQPEHRRLRFPLPAARRLAAHDSRTRVFSLACCMVFENAFTGMSASWSLQYMLCFVTVVAARRLAAHAWHTREFTLAFCCMVFENAFTCLMVVAVHALLRNRGRCEASGSARLAHSGVHVGMLLCLGKAAHWHVSFVVVAVHRQLARCFGVLVAGCGAGFADSRSCVSHGLRAGESNAREKRFRV